MKSKKSYKLYKNKKCRNYRSFLGVILKKYISIMILLNVISLHADYYSTKDFNRDMNKTFSKKNMNTAVDILKDSPDTVENAFSEKNINTAIDTLKNLPDIVENAVSDLLEALKAIIRKRYPFTPTLTDDQLAVRKGTDLCSRELKFLDNRIPKVQQALKQYFDIDAPLKIGFTCSGGGNRAMLVTLGFLLGAEDIGLYQSSLYMAGLSGGTWTITPFSWCHAKLGMTLSGFYEQLIGRIGSIMKKIPNSYKGIPVFSKDEKRNIDRNFAKRFSYGQHISSIDMYGAFIGDYTLLPAGDKRFNVTWSSIASEIEEGNIPFPMGSAVASKGSSKNETEYYWLEVGPFEVGSDQLKSYVPVQGFGAKYKKGRVVGGYAGHTPEYPMSLYEGVFGSAFTVSFNEMMDRWGKPKITMFGKTFELPIDDMFDDSKAGSDFLEGLRISPATFHNYTYQLKGFPYSGHEKIKLFDGGMNFNSPLPLVMRQARQVDLVVLCDAMEVDISSLKLAAIHFKRNNIKFPDMSKYTEEILAKPLTVLNDPRDLSYDKDMVTILYCPFTKNSASPKTATFDPEKCRKKSYCNVLNFNYDQKQADTVVSHMRYNVNFNKDEIKAVLQALQAKKLEKTVVSQAQAPILTQVQDPVIDQKQSIAIEAVSISESV